MWTVIQGRPQKNGDPGKTSGGSSVDLLPDGKDKSGKGAHPKNALGDCPWCLTYLQSSLQHTFEACRNKQNPRYRDQIEQSKRDGRLQVQSATATTASLPAPADGTGTTSVAATCFFCKDGPPHAFGDHCPMWSGFHRVNDAYHAANSATKAATAASGADGTLHAVNPNLRSFLQHHADELGRDTLASMLSSRMQPTDIARAFTTDTWVVGRFQEHEGTSTIWGPRDYLLKGYEEVKRHDPGYYKRIPEKRFRHLGQASERERRHAALTTRALSELATALDTLAALHHYS